ncbi:MAG: nucleotidyl transferase AbiEii/AbiGii toxin family protein [Thermoleophilia bacterium]|nr:nucleotidyl transferase AbiEii/AbiGii toxin family protein [Thermoleophilia bacterium]
MRLRRQIVFERVLARLVRSHPGVWLLKGGVALEARYRDRARATRDLDLAVSEAISGAGALSDLVVELLAADPDGDWFRLGLARTRDLTPDEAGRAGWRLTIRADLDGREFATVHVDIVARTDEVASTERMVMPNSLAFAGLPDVELDVVDARQHFAEKLHAYSTPRGSRENTRVRDLTDLVLIIEMGLESGFRLREIVNHVFRVRGAGSPPVVIPVPPRSWGATYAAQAAEIELEARTLAEAHRVVQEFWLARGEKIA